MSENFKVTAVRLTAKAPTLETPSSRKKKEKKSNKIKLQINELPLKIVTPTNPSLPWKRQRARRRLRFAENSNRRPLTDRHPEFSVAEV